MAERTEAAGPEERSGQWCRFLFKQGQDVYISKATEARETLIMIYTGAGGAFEKSLFQRTGTQLLLCWRR